MACNELFSLFNSNTVEGKDERTACIFPVIENLGFSSKFFYDDFFENCRKQSIYYDINRNSGTMFILQDRLESGCLGMMIIGIFLLVLINILDNDFKQIIKYASRTLHYIGNLMSFDGANDGGDLRKHHITVHDIADRLYCYQKQMT